MEKEFSWYSNTDLCVGFTTLIRCSSKDDPHSTVAAILRLMTIYEKSLALELRTEERAEETSSATAPHLNEC